MEQLKQTHQKLKRVSEERKTEETHLEDLNQQFVSLQASIEASLGRLASLKNEESSLQHKIFLLQKEALKENLNVNGLKKLFSDKNPLVKGIKSVLDKAPFDKQWIDEQYEKYKKIGIQNGEKIQSKEEFQKVISTIKEVKKDISGIQFSEIFSKAESELKKVGKMVQNTLSTTIEVTENESEKVDLPESKKEGLDLWLKNTSLNLSKTDTNALYEDYISYLNKTFGDKLTEDLIYSTKGGAFKQALSRTLKI